MTNIVDDEITFVKYNIALEIELFYRDKDGFVKYILPKKYATTSVPF